MVQHVIQSMKDALHRGEVSEFKNVNTKEMLADILTYDSVKSTMLFDAVKCISLPREHERHPEDREGVVLSELRSLGHGLVHVIPTRLFTVKF